MVSLNLATNHLVGGLPSALGDLSALQTLDLSNNQQTGPIPPQLGSLTSLQELNLGGNTLTGTIPSWLGRMVNLRMLNLSDNYLTGPVPPELGDLGNLTSLWIGNNYLSGSIPSELGSLGSLQELVLNSTFALEGPIPPSLGNLSNLHMLDLRQNRLSGEIPSELRHLLKLENLHFDYNQLSGPIPTWLGDLGNLTSLSLAENAFTGTIPAELGNLSPLRYLGLHGNQLTGAIPSELSTLVNLEEMSLGRNRLGGGIPSWLGTLTKLNRLFLGFNEFTGQIPTQLGSLVNLWFLNLSGNQLTGTVPSELGNLTKLGFLYLSINQFEGPLPLSLVNLPLYYFYYDRTYLCEPNDLQFRTWLQSIMDRRTTGIRCGSEDLFRPFPDGYGFSNSDSAWGAYPDPPAVNDFTLDDMWRMFGDDICRTLVDGVCTPKLLSQLWYDMYAPMDGHCFGMAATSARFFLSMGPSDEDDPSDFDVSAENTFDLLLETEVRRHIAYYHMLQFASPVRSYLKTQSVHRDLGDVVSELLALLGASSYRPPVIALHQYDPELSDPTRIRGHAVTPYDMEETEPGIWVVRVYDSNGPGLGGATVTIDVGAGSWSYNALNWSGGEFFPNTLGLVRLESLDDPATLLEDSAMDVWLAGKSDVLITSSVGDRIGYAGGTYVSEIGGAYIHVPLGSMQDPPALSYTLPITDTYEVALSTEANTQAQEVAFTQFGPDYAIQATGIVMPPNSQDFIKILPDGTEIVYRAGTAKEVTLSMTRDRDEGSSILRLAGLEIGATAAVTLTLFAAEGDAQLQNAQPLGGEYDLEYVHIDATGEQTSVEKRIPVYAYDTHRIEYDQFYALGLIVIHIDHGGDGTVDEIIEVRAITRRVFLPLVMR